MGRKFVIGDLHGRTSLLQKALEMVDFDTTKDVVYGVGDWIDRGEDSLGALSLLEHPWFKSVRGNHEQMLLDTMDLVDEAYANGGNFTMLISETYHLSSLPEVAWAYDLFKTYQPGDEDHPLSIARKRIETYMPYQMVVDHKWQLVHASPYEDGALSCMWGRHDALQAKMHVTFGSENLGILPEAGTMLTFVGHNVMPIVFHHNGLIYMDTGCGFNKAGDRLSMMEVTDDLIASYYGALIDGKSVWQPPILDASIDKYVESRRTYYTRDMP